MDIDRKYLLVSTLQSQLSALERVGLRIPSQDMISGVEASLAGLIAARICAQPLVMDFHQVYNCIVSLAKKIEARLTDVVFLSTAPWVALEGGLCLEINRLFSLDGKQIFIGPRPGHDDIHKQIAHLHRRLHGRKVVLIEDGSFTGGTLATIIKILKERSVPVEAVVLGILFPQAAGVLQPIVNGGLHCAMPDLKPYEWMPSHDFFPFVPNAGRVIGHKLGGLYMPVYTQHGMSIGMPYIGPYGDARQWASIPGSDQEIAHFSTKCLKLALSIFREMERLNNKEICIGDLAGSCPRVSIPVSSGMNALSGLEERVTDIIEGDIQFLS